MPERIEPPEEAVIAAYMVTGQFGRSWEELPEDEQQIERERIAAALPVIYADLRERLQSQIRKAVCVECGMSLGSTHLFRCSHEGVVDIAETAALDTAMKGEADAE